MARKIIICVINDLETDQRVHKTAMTCVESGLETTLVGRFTRRSRTLDPRPYQTIRFKLWFERSVLFYAHYNIRLFFFLVAHPAHLLMANDLDTLPAVWLASRFTRAKVLYDSHEYFLETPELKNRPLVRGIWSLLEGFIFPKLNHIFTVNRSIAKIYTDRYHKEVKVMRNLPYLHPPGFSGNEMEIPLPADGHLLIYQGAGINRDRGAEELVGAMSRLSPGAFFLLIVGSGDIFDSLRGMARGLGLEDRIRFIDRLPFAQLSALTRKCGLGITLDKDTNLNYRFSLPNKLFDYIHAGLPVLASNLPEVAAIVRDYQVGLCIAEVTPQAIAAGIREIFRDPQRYRNWKINAAAASRDLCWEKESRVLSGELSLLDPDQKKIRKNNL